MTRAQLLALVDAQFDDLKALQKEPTFLAYEQKFAQIWTTLGCDVLQATMGQAPENPQKKNCRTRFGTIELGHNHRFKPKVNGFFISPHLQNLMALAGVSDVYSAASAVRQ